MRKPLCFILFLLISKNLFAIESNIQSLSVRKTNKNSYEVNCVMSFPNIPLLKIQDFCWDIKTIIRLLNDDAAEIKYFGNETFLSISYVYNYLFFRYYSTYKRTRKDSSGSIYFEMVSGNHNIPFIPKIKKDTGEYTFALENNNSIVCYRQVVVCDGNLSGIYFNYVEKRIIQYFGSFVKEVNKLQDES